MRITDLLKKQGITLGASPKDKQGAIDILVKLHEKCGNLKDTAAYKKGILDREAMGTTAFRAASTTTLPTALPAS